MNLALNSAAESLIHQMVSSGQFDTPESVVESALFQAFSADKNAPVKEKRIIMDPSTSFDDGLVIELSRQPGVRVTAIPAPTKRMPDPIVLDLDSNDV